MKINDKIQLIRDELNNEIAPINTPHILKTANIEPLLPTSIKPLWKPSWQFALVPVFIIALIIPMMIALNPAFQDDSNPEADEPLYNSTDEVYGFVATSVVAMIYSTSDVFSSDNLLDQESSDLLVYEEIGFLNRFLSPIEMMLSYNYNHFFRQPSDNQNFTNKIIYDGVGLLGEDIFYEIYFNESLVANNRFEIECYVRSDLEVFHLVGNKTIYEQTTILEMTYYLTEDSTKDFVRVAKNLSLATDTYEYKVVKDDLLVSESKLSLVYGEEMYATLENILETEQTTTFKIYASTENKFEIDYTIAPPTDSETSGNLPTDETPLPIMESGTIAIDVEEGASSFFISSDNYNDVVIIDNPS
ncbi:MAG: hypothetical protein AB7V00_00650 [Bacilli bacterium]